MSNHGSPGRWWATAIVVAATAASAWVGGCAAVAEETGFTAIERRRLARITGLPAEGDLDASKLAAVTYATISPTKLPDFGDADCSALGRLPALGSVTLEGLPLSAACVDALAPRDLGLRLIAVEFTPATFAALGRMPALNNLRIEGGKGLGADLAAAFPPTSRLVRVTLGRVDGETLGRLRRLPRLTELEIAGVSGPQGLAPLEGAPELERVAIDVAGGADIAVLARLPKLANLVAGVDAATGEAGLRPLTGSRTLREVSLSFDDTPGAVGVGVLAEMPHLEHLGLVYQTVPDRELARLAGSRTLKSLDLREATVSDGGLLSLLKSRSLRSVDLWRVEPSPAVRRKLAKRFDID